MSAPVVTSSAAVPVPDPAAATPRRAALAYLPGLDGIRALALIAVLLFHGEMPWAAGGFLGVSVFFTLSGYLITTLILAEHEQTGALSLRGFWRRRFRRLAPASAVLLAALLVIGWIGGIAGRVTADIRAAALYVANWWFVSAGNSYADLFASPSPVAHFWSLAIEEQFYVVYPLVAWACVRKRDARTARRRLGVAVGVLAAGSVVAQLLLEDTNRLYLGTDTRAFELLAGAALAVALRTRGDGARPAGRLVTAGGVLALVAIGAASRTTSVGDMWLYRGGLVAIALGSCMLIVAASRPGPVARALGWGPLAHLGRISYGFYLLHWPVFVWLDERRTGWPLVPLLLVRLAVTWVLAELSYRLVERPIRLDRVLLGRRWLVAFSLGMVSVVGGSLLVPTQLDERDLLARAVDEDNPSIGVVNQGGPSTSTVPATTATPAPAAAPTTTAPPPPKRPVIALAGDSVPKVLATDIGDYGDRVGITIMNLGIGSCDGARGQPVFRYDSRRVQEEVPECTAWEQTWPPLFAMYPPDIVVFMLGGTIQNDRRIGGTWTNVCNPDFQAWYYPEILARIDWVTSRFGAKAVLQIAPWPEKWTFGMNRDARRRTDCANTLYERALQERPNAAALDTRGWLCPTGQDSCKPLRSDGLHYRGAQAVEFAEWMFPQLLALLPPGVVPQPGPTPPPATAGG